MVIYSWKYRTKLYCISGRKADTCMSYYVVIQNLSEGYLFNRQLAELPTILDFLNDMT